ncbi:MAG: hypothetical protein HQM09_03910 [Candidatus Riflebacteria bacterium]|nr:hypothetical protein [Candidatus Riflebacteria bacterium]
MTNSNGEQNVEKPRIAGGYITLGKTIPWVLALSFILDLSLRPFPLDSLTFRAWETATRYASLGAPFEPERSFSNPKVYGDLAAIGNIPSLRKYHLEKFSTDANGFRNSNSQGKLKGILVGDSFSAGSGVSDEETLSSICGELRGERILNAGAVNPNLHLVRRIAERENLRGGYVLYQHLERSPIPEPPYAPFMNNLRFGMDDDTQTKVYRWLGFIRGLDISPLQIAIKREFKELFNGDILPNIYCNSVVRKKLRNGDEMLFLPEDIREHILSPDDAVNCWKFYRDSLKSYEMDLLVILVPTKYTVYAPLLQPPQTNHSNLASVAARLNAEGIAAVDLTGVFQKEAAALLDKGEFIYWQDDTHWNAQGISIAAHKLVEKLSEVREKRDPGS